MKVTVTDSGTVEKIIRKFKRAKESSANADEYFAKLSAACPDGAIPKWTAEIEEAEKRRVSDPKSMDILEPRGVKRKRRA